MKVTGATSQQIERAAAETRVRLYNLRDAGRGYAFTLKTGEHDIQRVDWRGKLVWSPRYQRLSRRTQRSTAQGHEGKEFARVVPGAVCWHGHRDFFRALYRLAPKAVVRTAMAVYRGAEDFEAHFESTKRQLGSYSGPRGDADPARRGFRPFRERPETNPIDRNGPGSVPRSQ